MNTITVELLNALLSPDDSLRRQAEAVYQQLSNTEKLQGLVPHLGQQQQALAAVLMRREIIACPRVDVLHELLPHLTALLPHHKAVVHCLAELVASVAALDSDAAATRILDQLLLLPQQQQHANIIPLALAVAERSPTAFAVGSSSRYLDHLLPLASNRVDALTLVVRANHASHLAALLTSWPQPSSSSQEEENEGLVQALQGANGELLHRCASLVADRCVRVASASSTQVSVGLNALQLVVDLQGLSDALYSQVATVCAQLLVRHVQERYDEDDDENENEDDDTMEFAQAVFMPVAAFGMPLVQELLQTHPIAGLGLLEAALVASSSWETSGMLQQAVQGTLGLLLSSEPSQPRLTYQALHFLTVACEVAPEALGGQVPLVQAFLASADKSKIGLQGLIACARAWPPDMADQAQEIVPQIYARLPLSPTNNHHASKHLPTAIHAAAAWAQAVGDQTWFQTTIYPSLLQCLVQWAQQPQFLGPAVEGISLVGQAVGKDVFAADAHRTMQWMLPLLQNQDECLWAAARIASVLEDDFGPYLEAVLPVLWDKAQGAAQISLDVGGDVNAPTSAPENGTEQMTVAIPGRGLTTASLNVAAIQESAQAVRALYEIAQAVAPAVHVAKSLQVVVPLLDYPYSLDVRSCAGQTSAALLGAALQGEHWEVAAHYYPILVQKLSTQVAATTFQQDAQQEQEDEVDEASFALADSLSEVYYLVFGVREQPAAQSLVTALTAPLAQASIDACLQAMNHWIRQSPPLVRQDRVLTALVDSIGYTLKFGGAAFVSVMDAKILPVLGPYLTNASEPQLATAGLSLLADVVEYCGPSAAAHYAPLLWSGVFVALGRQERHDEWVQVALYGVAQIARTAPQTLASHQAPALMQQLLTYASLAKEEETDQECLIEYAASALGSWFLWGPMAGADFVNPQEVWSVVVQQMPLTQDPDEAKICHAAVCDLMQAGRFSAGRVLHALWEEVQEDPDLVTAETLHQLTRRMTTSQTASPGGGGGRVGGPAAKVVTP